MGSYESNELTIGSVLENRDQGFLLASFLKNLNSSRGRNKNADRKKGKQNNFDNNSIEL